MYVKFNGICWCDKNTAVYIIEMKDTFIIDHGKYSSILRIYCTHYYRDPYYYLLIHANHCLVYNNKQLEAT